MIYWCAIYYADGTEHDPRKDLCTACIKKYEAKGYEVVPYDNEKDSPCDRCGSTV